MDGFRRVFRLKEEQLCDDDVGRIIRDGTVDADNSLFQEAREDVVGSFSS